MPGSALRFMRPLPEPFRVSSDLKRRLSQANLRMLRCRPRPDPAPLGRQDRAFCLLLPHSAGWLAPCGCSSYLHMPLS